MLGEDWWSSHQTFISVYEPNISYYSRLGRVLVTYNSKQIEWCCPCAKARQSCIHKCIAKWHLFQETPALFGNVNCTEEDALQESFPNVEDVDGRQIEQGPGLQYPPDDPMLSRMVHYISKKKIPVDLPPDLVRAKSRDDFVMHLIPHETICTECTSHAPLSEPQLLARQRQRL